MAIILAAILDHEDEGHKERWNSELEGAGVPDDIKATIPAQHWISKDIKTM